MVSHRGAAAFRARPRKARSARERVILLKPTTYMNDSGRAVQEAANFFKLGAGEVTVFQDELELPPAKVRIKVGGGIAGHNGLRSITSHIGNDYRRVRLGIGHPGVKELVHHHVLSDFAKDDGRWVVALVRGGAPTMPHCSRPDEDSSFQNKVHLALQGKGFFDVSPKRRTVAPAARAIRRPSSRRDDVARRQARPRSRTQLLEDNSWDLNAVSSGCPMSANRPCSMH